MTLDEARSITCAVAWDIVKMPSYVDNVALYSQYTEAIQTYAAHHRLKPLDAPAGRANTWPDWAKYIVEMTIPKEHVPIDN